MEVIWILCSRKSFVFDGPWQIYDQPWTSTIDWVSGKVWPTLTTTQQEKFSLNSWLGLLLTLQDPWHIMVCGYGTILALCVLSFTLATTAKASKDCYYLQSTWPYWYWKEFSCGQTFVAISQVLMLYIQVVTNGPTSAIIQGLSCKSGWGLCSQVVVQTQGLLYIEKNAGLKLTFVSGTSDSDFRQHKI